MFYFCKYGVCLLLLLFAGIYCFDDDDEGGDVVGYGVYQVYISNKRDADVLNDMATNKIIYPMKRSAFEWKVLVRSNHEHYFQRKLIERKISYYVVQSSMADSTFDLARANTGEFNTENSNQPRQTVPPGIQNTNSDRCFPTILNCIPDSPKYFPSAFNPDNQFPGQIPQPPFIDQNQIHPIIQPNGLSGKYNNPQQQIYPQQNMQMMNPSPYAPYYPPIQQQQGYNNQNNPLPPGNYFYCYLTGGCIPLPPFSNSQIQPVQQTQYQNNPYPMNYPKYPAYQFKNS